MRFAHVRKFRHAALALGLIATPLSAHDTLINAEDGDWPLYARDHAGQRYSPLTEINRENIDQLERAWSLQLRPNGGGAILAGSVPIVIDGTMYLVLGDAVVAVEAHTGREIWRYQASGFLRRSVTWWPGDHDHNPRLYYSSGNALHAIDAETGQAATDFGVDGKAEFEGTPYGYPPSIFGNTLIIGALSPEISEGPSGNTRGFDAITGEKKWEFNVVPRPGEIGHETWLDDGWVNRPGNNMWVWYTTADVETGLVFMTLGSPGPNYWGGDRPGANLFGNSVVAVHAETGEYAWHFQTIHHDLWDWDLPAPPVLIDVEVDGEVIPALAETGKPGLMYILDRRTGEPIHGVNEHFVSAANVPGEYYHPTQPIPVRPAPLSRMWWDITDVVTEEDTTPEHVAACHALLDSYGGTFYNSGPFTPFFLHEEGDPPRASINLPHNGGSNWGGSAADPTTGYIYINTSESGSIGWIEERDPEGDYGRGTAESWQPYDRGSLSGPGAYSSFSAAFENENGQRMNLPCIRPPWGRLHAVDGNTGEIAWSVPLGTTPGLPEGKQNTGSNNTFGGPTVTAGGLVFMGATSDGYFRAFDAETGELVWSEHLDYAAMTIPVSYEGSDGKQYIAVYATGSAFGAPVRGEDGRPANNEALITWALPE